MRRITCKRNCSTLLMTDATTTMTAAIPVQGMRTALIANIKSSGLESAAFIQGLTGG